MAALWTQMQHKQCVAIGKALLSQSDDEDELGEEKQGCESSG